MTEAEFCTAINTLSTLCDAICWEMDANDKTPDASRLDAQEFQRFIGQLDEIRADLFTPKWFGRGLPDEGVYG
jgi:hypothetical protein